MLDATLLDSNNERRSGSSTSLTSADSVLQWLGVEWQEHTEEEDEDDIEEEDTVEGELDGTWNNTSWVGSLSNGDTDQLGTQIREDGGCHGTPSGKETTSSALHEVWVESTWVFPVLETSSGQWSTTRNQDQAQQDEAENDDDLDTGQPLYTC